jgi:hypothetical protein
VTRSSARVGDDHPHVGVAAQNYGPFDIGDRATARADIGVEIAELAAALTQLGSATVTLTIPWSANLRGQLAPPPGGVPHAGSVNKDQRGHATTIAPRRSRDVGAAATTKRTAAPMRPATVGRLPLRIRWRRRAPAAAPFAFAKQKRESVVPQRTRLVPACKRPRGWAGDPRARANRGSSTGHGWFRTSDLSRVKRALSH